MIRFVDVGNQIGYGVDAQGEPDDKIHQFSFYCTVRDAFLQFNDEMFFSSRSHFLKCFKEDKYDVRLFIKKDDYLERLTNHITDKFNF